jgi:hypothetical protein
MKEGFDQATEKNQSGEGRCTSESNEFIIPFVGLNIQTKIMHDATRGTIDGI